MNTSRPKGLTAVCNLDYADDEYLLVHQGHPTAAWPRPCDDCGRTIARGETHETVTWAEWTFADRIDEYLALPYGDLMRQWAEEHRGPRARYPYQYGYGDDRYPEIEFDPTTRTTAVQCAHCEAAARWVREVCGGLMYATACQQLAEHWVEDTVYRCRPFARLVLYSGGRFDEVEDAYGFYSDTGPILSRTRKAPWTDRHGDLIPVATVNAWVDGALAKYRSTLPATAAAA